MSKFTVRTPILITGCQRSGTTLLRLILNSHPGIGSIDEDVFHFPSVYGYLSVPQGPPRVAFKLPCYAHLLPFIKMLPDCRVVWCIREPLDAVWSMLKLELTTSNATAPWAAHPDGGWLEVHNSYWVLEDAQKRGLRDHMKRFGILTGKVARQAASPGRPADFDRLDQVFIGALCWRIKNELPALYRAAGIDFHVLRYGELVTDPASRIAELLDYVGAPWSDEVLMHHRLHQGTSIGETSNTRPIDTGSLGQGRLHLKAEEQELIRSVCGPTARQWGYALE